MPYVEEVYFRQIRATVLLIGEIVRACPNIHTIEFGSPYMDDGTEKDVQDYAFSALLSTSLPLRELKYEVEWCVDSKGWRMPDLLQSLPSLRRLNLSGDFESWAVERNVEGYRRLFEAVFSLPALEELVLSIPLPACLAQLPIHTPLKRLELVHPDETAPTTVPLHPLFAAISPTLTDLTLRNFPMLKPKPR
jgi:hypothetical protein